MHRAVPLSLASARATGSGGGRRAADLHPLAILVAIRHQQVSLRPLRVENLPAPRPATVTRGSEPAALGSPARPLATPARGAGPRSSWATQCVCAHTTANICPRQRGSACVCGGGLERAGVRRRRRGTQAAGRVSGQAPDPSSVTCLAGGSLSRKRVSFSHWHRRGFSGPMREKKRSWKR